MKTKLECSKRAKALFEEGKTGYLIACTLRAEGYSPKEAVEALKTSGFSVHVEEVPWGTILSVSSSPPQDVFTKVLEDLFGGGKEVAWHK